jgi:glycosyltransferase involved in cell wall biosynthesis
MSLNKYQLALGGQLGRSLPGNIRGILFNPLGRSGKLLNDFLLGPRKKAQISWMLRNEKINRIFLLNDKEKAVELNKYYKKREAFKSLPDPVQPLSSAQSDPVSITEDDQGRIKFLLFGSLSESKGIFIVLDALKVLPSFVSSQIEIIFAGNLSNNIRNKFLDHLSQFRKRDSKLKVTLLDKFLSNLEAANLFSSVDFVLAPYIGSEASSGIIGYAAAYKKPVIGTNKGLLGSLIINYQLGFAIYPMNADNLSSIIQRVITYDFNTIETRGMEQFVKERHPDNFVFNLIN